MNSAGPRIALVAPYFGRDLRGRKERFTFDFATHLALEGLAVDVITTTTTPDASDENFYREGHDQSESFPVFRFRVLAPDRAAYEDAVIAASAQPGEDAQPQDALLQERLRSPELLAHVRATAEHYDAFVFADISVQTTVAVIDAVSERAVLLPMLDDEPVVRLAAVAAAVARARVILCTTDAEAALMVQTFGALTRPKIEVIGLGIDAIPDAELRSERIERTTQGRPYVLCIGDEPNAIAAIKAGGYSVVNLSASPERRRASLFAFARAVAVVRAGAGFVPEVAEAWSYGKPVLSVPDAIGAALLIRASGGGAVVVDGNWATAIADVQVPDRAAAIVAQGAALVDAWGGWRKVAARTSAAIASITAREDGRSESALLAQVGYLYPLVQRQRRVIEAMRVSRFWRLRDLWFGLRRRLGIGPPEDPIPAARSTDRAAELAALGDPYQLFTRLQGLRESDMQRVASMAILLPRTIVLTIVIDLRWGVSDDVISTLRSLSMQLYPHWNAQVVLGEHIDDAAVERLTDFCAGSPRVSLVRPGGDRLGNGDFVGALEAGDRLERHALFEFALTLQREDVDVVYCDEDRLDARGVRTEPWFKPDWSPETLLTRDYVGRLCLMRAALLSDCGGVRDVFENVRWYEALLRLTERTDRIVHIPQVLCHRDARNIAAPADIALAVEVTLQRREEPARVLAAVAGADVQFALRSTPLISIIVPTRDRTDLLGPCIASIFEHTSYSSFEVVVIDNGSREAWTQRLLNEWKEREPQRFQVRRDASPFNYSRLNNDAVRETDAPYIVLLNNDTEVIAPDWLDALLGQAQRPAIGAVGAALLYGDGTVQHAGIVLGILGLAGHAHRFVRPTAAWYHGALSLDTNCLAVTGACLMVAKEKYNAVGGLDEAMPVSYNDVDLCLKLHRAGYRNVIVPRARLFHYESKTRGKDNTPAKVARAIEEVALIRSRWPQFAERDPYYNPNLTVDAEDFSIRL